MNSKIIIISAIKLYSSLVLPSSLNTEKTTIGHPTQNKAERMRDGTIQMRDGLKNALLRSSTDVPDAEEAPQDLHEAIHQGSRLEGLLIITKMPLYPKQ